ncbi:MAG: 30S ribosomal protein S17 [Pseudobdellovibrionaceae bacterium]
MQKRRTVVGTVVSNKMQKTIVVKVDRRVRDELYRKYVTRTRKVKAHDETNSAKPGDLVQLVETKPLSKDKRWSLSQIMRRAGQAPEANI